MQKYGPIYKTHLLGKPTIRVIGAENVKKIVLGENDIVTQMWPSSTRLLLGGGSISMSSGDIHRVRRKQMLTVFSLDILYDFVPVLQEKICDVLEAWCQKRDILGYPECKRMALVAAARLMLGLEVDSKKGEELSWVFQDFLNNIMSIPFDMPGFGFHKVGMNYCHSLVSLIHSCMIDSCYFDDNNNGLSHDRHVIQWNNPFHKIHMITRVITPARLPIG